MRCAAAALLHADRASERAVGGVPVAPVVAAGIARGAVARVQPGGIAEHVFICSPIFPRRRRRWPGRNRFPTRSSDRQAAHGRPGAQGRGAVFEVARYDVVFDDSAESPASAGIFDLERIMLTAVKSVNELTTANRLRKKLERKKLDMTRLVLAGVTLLAFVSAGLAGPGGAPPPGYKPSPPLVYKAAPASGAIRNARPRNLPASATKNDVLFRQFLEWQKKQRR
jgi:hypothetical protein